jgi:hypothetical protein
LSLTSRRVAHKVARVNYFRSLAALLRNFLRTSSKAAVVPEEPSNLNSLPAERGVLPAKR